MGGTSRISSREDARRALTSTRDSSRSFDYSDHATRSGVGSVHTNLDPKGVVRECLDTEAMPVVTPIAFAMDVTRSRGQDTKIIHSQLLPMLGAMYLSDSITDPQLLFAAFGDAKSDRAPLQVGQFESDERMDTHLERFWLEEGGGGTGEESSELFAYFLARKTKVDAIDKRGQKGFCFITSDEAPYPTVSKDEVKRIIGDDLAEDIPTPVIFAELQKRYWTYLLYPGKPIAQRQDDIDAEIGYSDQVTKLGVLRAYHTRHGAGPFVTHDRILSAALPDPHNGADGWQGEFRVGWFDLVMARYAQVVAQADSLAITHLDRYATIGDPLICVAYEAQGEYIQSFGMKTDREDLRYQESLTQLLSIASPVYKRSPKNTEEYLQLIERELGIPVTITSHGSTFLDKRMRATR